MANILFNWLMCGLITMLHPFFVSKVEINHNPKNKSVEVTMKIFTDDFENTLKKYSKTTIDLSGTTHKEETDKTITNYVIEKLKISIDNSPTVLQYMGYEITKESVWIYCEVDNIATCKKMDIDCSLLYDYKKEQMNIIQAKANGKEENYKLDYPKSKISFSF